MTIVIIEFQANREPIDVGRVARIIQKCEWVPNNNITENRHIPFDDCIANIRMQIAELLDW